jgi:hypothetical protein
MAEETTIDETDREVLQVYASHVALRNKGCFVCTMGLYASNNVSFRIYQ